MSLPALAQDTNPPDIQLWYQSLTNRMGGSCCGEADGYAANVIKEPTLLDRVHGGWGTITDGVACITDPSAKEIWVHGFLLKTRPGLKPGQCINFSSIMMTREKHGNPFDHAIVFLRADLEGTVSYVYCVVPLAQIY